MFSFGKLVSFALILLGLWSLFRFMGRLDKARRDKPNAGKQRRDTSGNANKAGSSRRQKPNMVQANTLVQCPKCDLYHEAGKPCPDCNPRA